MDNNDFSNERMGKTEWESNGMFYYFKPNELPFNIEQNEKLESLALRAAHALGKIDNATKKCTPNEITLIQMPFILKEATSSSQIEGTRSTISDVLKEEKVEEKNIELRLDNEEVRNYRDAMNYALNESPEHISEEFIKEIHRKLMKGVRGKDKNPGEYKIKQNAIGRREDNLDTAKFVPASPQDTPYLMTNLVNYINNNKVNPIYKIAIVHYQFEAIHPFRDGNGRIGRLLMVLQLCREKLLSTPIIYLSEYLNRNRDDYVNLLFNASTKGEIENFIEFILKGIIIQCNKSQKLLEDIELYRREIKIKMRNKSKSYNMEHLIDFLIKNPFFTVEDIKEELNISQPGAWQLVQKLKEEKIVIELEKETRKKLYCAHELLRLLEFE